jgi:EpsI family protein
MNFLQGKYTWVLTVALLAQAGVYYAVAARSEVIPVAPPLGMFPVHFGDWQMQRDYPMDPEVQSVLKADDTITRDYVNLSRPAQASLFIAFFKTQRYNQTPHSPKVCLPAQGWEPTENETQSISVAGRSDPIIANRYLVSRGQDQMLSIYWYQSHDRIIANDYLARFWLVVDAIRYHRSDTSIIRVMAKVYDGDIDSATKTCVSFIQAMFPSLQKQLPL